MFGVAVTLSLRVAVETETQSTSRIFANDIGLLATGARGTWSFELTLETMTRFDIPCFSIRVLVSCFRFGNGNRFQDWFRFGRGCFSRSFDVDPWLDVLANEIESELLVGFTISVPWNLTKLVLLEHRVVSIHDCHCVIDEPPDCSVQKIW